MNLESSDIWISYLEQSRTLYPRGLKPSFMRVGEWLKNGSVPIGPAPQKRGATFESAIPEVCGCLLNEAGLLLDHATEHKQAVFGDVFQSARHSNAWLITTIYYWYFFVVLSWTRLAGSTTLFLDAAPVLLQALYAMQGIKGSVGSGTFNLEVVPSDNDGFAFVDLQRSKSSRFHDAVWKRYFSFVERTTSDVPVASKNLEAIQLLRSLNSEGLDGGKSWPSILRNSVNYRPGFFYTAGSRHPVDTNLRRFIDRCSSLRLEELLERTSEIRGQCKATSINSGPLAYACLLYLNCVAADFITNKLYGEIAKSGGGNRIAAQRRTKIDRELKVGVAGSAWPLSF